MNVEETYAYMKEKLTINKVMKNEPMRRHISFRIGGPADILVIPETIDEIRGVLEYTRERNIPLFVLGNGSNLIVRDKGIRGVVVKILSNFNSISIKDDIIEAEAGILLSKLSNHAMMEGLSGLEFACGIPGTLGGAITMNAGAYGGQISDVVESTQYIDEKGNIAWLDKDSHSFGYRSSFYSKGNKIVLKAIMRMAKSSKNEIRKRMDELNTQRINKQPLSLPSAGSVFKRPQGYFAGKLIEDAGLRGYTLGGAQVSDKHCGFIVNKDGATAEDIINLIEYVKGRVRELFGVELETEVKIVGED